MSFLVSIQNNTHNYVETGNYLTYLTDFRVLAVQEGEGMDANQTFIIETDAANINQLRLGQHDFRIKPYIRPNMILTYSDDQVQVVDDEKNNDEMVLRLHRLSETRSAIMVKNDEEVYEDYQDDSSNYNNAWAVSSEYGITVVESGSRKEKKTNSWVFNEKTENDIKHPKGQIRKIEFIDISDDEVNQDSFSYDDEYYMEDNQQSSNQSNHRVKDYDSDEEKSFPPPNHNHQPTNHQSMSFPIGQDDVQQNDIRPQNKIKEKSIDFEQMKEATEQSLGRLAVIDKQYEDIYKDYYDQLDQSRKDGNNFDEMRLTNLIRENQARRTVALRDQAQKEKLYSNEVKWYLKKLQETLKSEYPPIRKMTEQERNGFEILKSRLNSRYLSDSNSRGLRYYPDYLLESEYKTEENEQWLTDDTIDLPTDWQLTFNVADITTRLSHHKSDFDEIRNEIQELEKSLIEYENLSTSLSDQLATLKPKSKQYQETKTELEKVDKEWYVMDEDRGALYAERDYTWKLMEELDDELEARLPIAHLISDMDELVDQEYEDEMKTFEDKLAVVEWERVKDKIQKLADENGVDFGKDNELENKINGQLEIDEEEREIALQLEQQKMALEELEKRKIALKERKEVKLGNTTKTDKSPQKKRKQSSSDDERDEISRKKKRKQLSSSDDERDESSRKKKRKQSDESNQKKKKK